MRRLHVCWKSDPSLERNVFVRFTVHKCFRPILSCGPGDDYLTLSGFHDAFTSRSQLLKGLLRPNFVALCLHMPATETGQGGRIGALEPP